MFYKKYNLMYCSNIFKNNTQKQLFNNLNKLIKKLKSKFNKEKKFSIGLCASNKLSNELIKNINIFSKYIKKKKINIPSLNGFSYNNFHKKITKDNIYWPDWSSIKRVNYTNNLIKLLDNINNKNKKSISTMPISYKGWINKKNTVYIYYKTAKNLTKVTENIIKNKSNIIISIEPEPTCLIEKSQEFINYFNNWIKPLYKKYSINNKKNIKNIIGICYDICHFAVQFEKHEKILNNLEKENIIIGKLQISSALKINDDRTKKENKQIIKNLNVFKYSSFLHQINNINKNKTKIYKDIKYSIKYLKKNIKSEWRIHFHIPIYINKYKNFRTTNNEIKNVMQNINKKNFTGHIEIETYTYKNLSIRYDILNSIINEYKWIRTIIKRNVK